MPYPIDEARQKMNDYSLDLCDKIEATTAAYEAARTKTAADAAVARQTELLVELDGQGHPFPDDVIHEAAAVALERIAAEAEANR